MKPCEQFADAERLGSIVVRAGIQCGDLLPLLVACGKDKYRDLGPGLDGDGQVLTVAVRQPDVQDHGVGRLLSHQRGAVADRRGLLQAIALGDERDPEEVSDGCLVLDGCDERRIVRCVAGGRRGRIGGSASHRLAASSRGTGRELKIVSASSGGIVSVSPIRGGGESHGRTM